MKRNKLPRGPAPSRAAMKKPAKKSHCYPWDEIEKFYVEGELNEEGVRIYPSQPELHERYGIHPTVIGRRSSKGQWLFKRERFADRLREERQKRIINESARVASNADAKAIKLADNLLSLVGGRMGALLVEEKDKDGKVTKRVKCDAQELSALGSAIKKAQDALKVAVGETPDNAENPLFALAELQRRAKEAQETERGG